MNPNLTLVREKVIAANPSILDLQFGCEVERGAGSDVSEIFISEVCGEISLMRRNKIGDWQPFQVPSELKNSWGIVGRPIRLADVLEAMDNAAKGDLQQTRENLIAIYDKWNLLDDDLSHQSQETIDFLAEILK